MTAIVTADQLVSGLAARIRSGTDSNSTGDNKQLKDAMVSKNFFDSSSGGTATGLTAGSTSVGFINYNGTTPTAGQWYGGTQSPTGTTRLTYNGKLVSNTAIIKDGLNIIGTSYPGIGIATSETQDSSSTYAIMTLWNDLNKVVMGAVGPSTVTTICAGGVHGNARAVIDVMPDRVDVIYDLYVGGKLVASSPYSTSDKQYKTNVAELSGSLDIVNKLTPVEFEWKQHPVHKFPEGKTLGFIAQDVVEALSDTAYAGSIVTTNTCNLPDGTTEEYMAIAEGNIVALLASAVKELTTITKDLKSEVAYLKQRVQDLSAQVGV